MQLQQDTLFDNRYTLRQLIGRGGFSEVWLAHDTWTELDIAIKVYAPGQGMDTNGLQIFSKELAGVFNLNQANLLKPTHVGQWLNMPYLIMEYCPKGALNKQVGKLTEQEVWKVLHDVAAGLAYLHAKEIVHQDIKPDNILLDENGDYRITDFGISTKARTTLRRSIGAAAVSGGTTAYMAPERFSANPAPTKASDIWSLGAMVFELITGDVPFGEIGGGLQKNGADIPTIHPAKGVLSAELTHVVRLMLAPNAWDRPTADTIAIWAANPSLVKPVASVPSRPTQRQTNTSAATSSTTATARPTQRVNTPPTQPRPTVSTPQTDSRPVTTPKIPPTPQQKKSKAWKVLITTIILGVSAFGVYDFYFYVQTRNRVRTEYSKSVEVCYSKLREIDTNRPQTIIDIYNEGGGDMNPNLLRGAYCIIQRYESNDFSYIFIDHSKRQNICNLWNDKKEKCIQTLKNQQRKEYDNWGCSSTYNEYNNKIKEVKELKLLND